MKRIEAVGASGKSAFPYIPITTGIITNGISTAAAIIGDQNATFSSLQEAVRWYRRAAEQGNFVDHVAVQNGTGLKALAGSAADMASNPPCIATITMQKTVEKNITRVCTESVIITPHIPEIEQ